MSRKPNWKNILQIIIAAIMFPVLIPRILLFLGQQLDSMLFSSPLFHISPVIGLFISLIGFLTSIFSIYQLYRVGSGMPWGDVSTDDQSINLVTEGLYRYSRNPMLLGFGLYIMGIGLFFGSFSTALLLSSLVVLMVSLWIKLIEEPELVKRFGPQYIKYREETPFLVPRIQAKRNDMLEK